MDLSGFSPRLARLSGGSSGYSLSGGLSGFLGSGGSNELWSLGSGAAQQQQQQQQQYNVGAGMGSGGGTMMMGGYPGGHMQQPSMASQVGTQGAVVGMGHQAPPPLVDHHVTSTPSSGTDGEHRDRCATRLRPFLRSFCFGGTERLTLFVLFRPVLRYPRRSSSDPVGHCCSGPVIVSLYHRMRTAKGWSLISANDKVRVTKGHGKVPITDLITAAPIRTRGY